MTQVALSTQQQQQARNAAVQAALLGWRNAPAVHYTQGSLRWQGIATRRIASKGQYPNYADCSAFATWSIWNGLVLLFGMEDVVNAANWAAGFTGTMLANGTSLGRASDMLPGDCVIYGTRGTSGEHTAIVVVAGAVPIVISHGSESGPYRVPYNYRSDIMSLRRYIDGKPHEATGGSAPTPTPPKPPKPKEIEMITSAVADNGSLHTFVVGPNRKIVWYTWQRKGQSGWSGGQKGKQVAKLTKFADSPGGDIRGISASKNAQGALHIFVTLKDGSTVYTWQPSGKTAWNGHGKNRIASLNPFAPAP